MYLAVLGGATDPQDENHHIPNRALSLFNSTGVSGGLQQQWSREETYNRDEDLLSQLSPFYWRETTVPITWWSQKGPWVVMILAAVMILLFVVVANYGSGDKSFLLRKVPE